MHILQIPDKNARPGRGEHVWGVGNTSGAWGTRLGRGELVRGGGRTLTPPPNTKTTDPSGAD